MEIYSRVYNIFDNSYTKNQTILTMKHSKITMTPTNDISFDLLPKYMWSRIYWEYSGEALLLKRRPIKHDCLFD